MQAHKPKNEGKGKMSLENVTRLRRVVCLHLETRPLANHRTVLSRLIEITDDTRDFNFRVIWRKINSMMALVSLRVLAGWRIDNSM